MHNVSAENNIDLRERFSHSLCYMLLLYHTAADRNYEISVLLFQLFECAYIAENSVLCVFSYGAGIEKDKIRKGGFGREAVTHLCKHTLYFFSVAHVLLTAEAVDVRKRHLLTLCVYRFYFFYIFLLNKQFFLVYLFSQAVSPFFIQSPVAKTVYHKRQHTIIDYNIILIRRQGETAD